MSLWGCALVTQILMISVAVPNGLFRGVVTTILFEFGFGHYLRGFSRSQLMRDDIVRAGGHLCVVVLRAVRFSPFIVKRTAASCAS